MTVHVPRAEVDDLPRLLEWDEGTPTHWRQWLARYDAFVERRFDELVGQLDAESEQLLRTGFSLLSPEQQRRILCSPWITDRLARRSGPVRDPTSLYRAVLAELDPEQASTVAEGPLTTALGDATYVSGRASYDARPLAAITAFPIDYGSDRGFPFMHGCGNALESLAPADAERMAETVRSTLDDLEHALPDCAAIVRSFTRVLVLRRETEEPDRFRSGTFDRYVGLVFFRNVHLETASSARLIDALVHESIHNLLFVCEAVTRPFWDELQAVERRLPSPWTGASLALPSFLHACFVWYGLFWLWARLLECEAPPTLTAPAEARRLRDRAWRGFSESDLGPLLLPLRGILDADLVNMALDLQHRIRGASPHRAAVRLLT